MTVLLGKLAKQLDWDQMKRFIGLITALLLASPVMAETALYCQEIASGGVILKGGRRTHTNFNLTRYTFLLSDDRRTLKTQGDEYRCHARDYLGWLTCLVTEPMFPYNIILSDDLKRFQISKNRPSAYVEPLEGYRQSSISIGNCEKF